MGYIVKQQRLRAAFTNEAANAALRGAVEDLREFYDDVAGEDRSTSHDDMHLALLRAVARAAERVVYETAE